VKIKVYVEGGPRGVDADGVRSIRKAFKQHFERLDPRLKTLDVVARGSTDQTIKSYSDGVRQDSSEYSVALLVDSDAVVTANTPAMHIQAKLDAAHVAPADRENIFLMVQCMEAWLVTDPTALEKCFGAKARDIKLPPNPNIEAVPIKDILAALDSAARSTPTRHYHKIRDGARILAELNPELVAKRSKHAVALHEFLRRSVGV
jgi:hypothetical protein